MGVHDLENGIQVNKDVILMKLLRREALYCFYLKSWMKHTGKDTRIAGAVLGNGLSCYVSESE